MVVGQWPRRILPYSLALYRDIPQLADGHSRIWKPGQAKAAASPRILKY